ncbi:MAG TPA: M20/M25/M40 family metallo-hydrolase [Actinomycetes bacterium]|nr:M20/M25/M40 family metallo-hydrolase [Actinomycetes bacterium]
MEPRGPEALARRLLAGALAALLLVGCTSSPGPDERQGASSSSGTAATQPAPRAQGTGPLTADGLRAAVTAEAIRRHLDALQQAADRNGGNRAAGTRGYDASVQYVADQLRQVGYRPQLQRFDATTARNRTAPVLELPGAAGGLRADQDFRPFAFSGNGDVAAATRPVDLASGAAASTSGCEPADFTGFPRGTIAVLERGTCPFRAKAENAQQAGAAAAVIFDRGQPGVVSGTLGGPGISIPVVAVAAQVARELTGANAGQQARVRVDVESRSHPTSNVLAELPGDSDRVVMVGAHLDSVPAGPGMNDNASGSATILELARQLAATKPTATVRFAWWGSEELGLLGSRHYLEQLSPADRDRIALYLNLDMVGSRNVRRLVYDGSARGAPPGSQVIQQVLTDYLRGQDLAVGTTSLGGGSDHAPFAAAGIPVGGLFTGAGEAKSEQDEDQFGGTAGEPADPCYHQRCDDLGNLDLAVLDQMADAAAHAVATFARDTTAVDRARG